MSDYQSGEGAETRWADDDVSTSGPVQRMLRAVRQFSLGYARIHERQSLLNRPWQEDFLHFARDGSLHGHLAPPPDGRRRSVTSDGWCPGWAQSRTD